MNDSITVARARTFVLWVLMRLRPYPKLTHRLLRPFAPVVARGRLLIRSGLATRVWLDARHFDPTGAQSYMTLTGAHEPMVQEALRRTVPENGVVFDVGANIGFSALVAARLTGPGGTVVAFEPQPESVAAIRANAAANGFAHLQVVEAAAGASSGEAELIVVADSLWTRLATVGEHDLEAQRLTVRVMALDDAELPAPDVVKIDVEGAELDVLDGMQRLLAEHRPVLIVEMHGKNAEFVSRMRAAGYRVVNLEGTSPVEDADGNVHVLCEPR